MSQLVFRPAQASELSAVEALYRAASGSPYSVWDENYPTLADARHDLETGNLFVLMEGAALAGSLSIVPEREMDDLPCWTVNDGTQCEIARIAIASAYQGRGLAARMVLDILPILKERGCHTVRLSAAVTNLPAWKTYRRLGFQTLGEADLFSSRYYLMEKNL